MDEKEQQKVNQKKKFNWQFVTTLAVSAAAIVLSVVALLKGGQPGPAGPQGTSGSIGQNGSDGQTPYIGTNGNWWIGETDTNVKAEGSKGSDGVNGKTPFIGSNGNWWIGEVDTNVKASGTSGTDGNGIKTIAVKSSSATETIYVITFTNNQTFEFTVKNGSDGESAYDLAVENGFEGSEEEWIESLKAVPIDMSLASIDDYFTLLDSTKEFNYSFSFTDTDYPRIAGLENVSDATAFYNSLEPATYTFTSYSLSLPTETDPISKDQGEPPVQQIIDFPVYVQQETSSISTMEINKVGEGEGAYIAVNLTGYRDYQYKELGIYFEGLEEYSNLTNNAFYIYDFAEFTMIDNKYYMIYSCPTFGFQYYVIQEFSKEVYEYVVASIVYGISSLPYSEGADYYLNLEGAEFYKTDFLGSKTNNTAKASFSSNYTSEMSFADGKLLSLSSKFHDSLGLTANEAGFGLLEQEVSVIYADSEHTYPTSLPNSGNWQYAGPYWYEETPEKAKYDDLVIDHDAFSSLIYQIIDIFRTSYLGIPLKM